MVKFLLDCGASLEQVVPEDENALITASRTGQANVVRLLIGRGANVKSQAFGRTPLAMAQLRNHEDIVDMLRKAGAVR
jgi:ankyrin repeat protein